MAPWMELNTFTNDGLGRRLADALTEALQVGCSRETMSKNDFAALLSGVLGRFTEVQHQHDYEGVLAQYGLVSLFFDRDPKAVVLLCPIVEIMEGRRIRDFSSAEAQPVATANGETVVFTQVLLSEPLYSHEPAGGLPGAFLLRGNVFILEHVLRDRAEGLWPTVHALHDALQKYGNIFGEGLLFRGFSGVLPGRQAEWSHALKAVELLWISDFLGIRLCVGGEQELTQEGFIKQYVAEMRDRFVYHEIAGHYVDQLEHGHTQGVPKELAGLYEVRAALAQITSGGCALYGVVELLTFMCETGTYHHEYAEKVLSALFLQKDYVTPDSVIEVATEIAGSGGLHEVCERARSLLNGEFALPITAR